MMALVCRWPILFVPAAWNDCAGRCWAMLGDVGVGCTNNKRLVTVSLVPLLFGFVRRRSDGWQHNARGEGKHASVCQPISPTTMKVVAVVGTAAGAFRPLWVTKGHVLFSSQPHAEPRPTRPTTAARSRRQKDTAPTAHESQTDGPSTGIKASVGASS